MSRINVVSTTTANEEQRALLGAIQSQLGLHGIANGGSLDAARAGTSGDAKAAVAVRFARIVAANLGEVSGSDLMEVRAAGYNDADIVEIITHTAMNILTNMIGKASKVAIDFPKVDLKLAA